MKQFKKHVAQAAFIIMVTNSCQTAQAIDWRYWSGYKLAQHTLSKEQIIEHPKTWGVILTLGVLSALAGMYIIKQTQSELTIEELRNMNEEQKTKTMKEKLNHKKQLQDGLNKQRAENLEQSKQLRTERNKQRAENTKEKQDQKKQLQDGLNKQRAENLEQSKQLRTERSKQRVKIKSNYYEQFLKFFNLNN